MKFLIDAHFPLRLKTWLTNQGHDVKHTLDLPLQNLTSDNEILQIVTNEARILITKDSDFRKTNLIHGIPKYLIFVTTGNIQNKQLLTLFENNFPQIEKLFIQEGSCVIELNTTTIVIHR